MDTYTTGVLPSGDFVINTRSGTVEFYDSANNVSGGDVAFSICGSGFQSPTFIQQSQRRYFLGATMPDNNCSRCTATVRWKSKTDGNYHYCDDITLKHKPLVTGGTFALPAPNYAYSSGMTTANNVTINKNYDEVALRVSTLNPDEPPPYSGNEAICRSYSLRLESIVSRTFYYTSWANYCFISTPLIMGSPVYGGSINISISGNLANITGLDLGSGEAAFLLYSVEPNTGGTCGPAYATPTPRPPTATPRPTATTVPTTQPTVPPTATPIPGDIRGRIFIDSNSDTVRQAEETLVTVTNMGVSAPQILSWYRPIGGSWTAMTNATLCNGGDTANNGPFRALNLPPGLYQLHLAINTPNWVFTRTGADNYTNNPGGGVCSWSGGTPVAATCQAGSGDNCTDVLIDNVDVSADQDVYIWTGVKENQQTWFQIRGGGAYVREGISASVPAGSYMIEANTVAAGGVLATAQDAFSLPEGTVSDNDWKVVGDSYRGTTYQESFFDQRLATPGETTTLIDLTTQTALSQVDQLGETVSSGEKIIIRKSNGEALAIDRNVVVVAGGFLAVISAGNLTITGSTTSLDGFYVSDKSITVEDGANQLVIDGGVISDADMTGGENFAVNRSLDAGNSQPAVIVSYRPDLLFSMPKELWKRKTVYRQLLP